MGLMASFFSAFDKSDLYVILLCTLFTVVAVILMRRPSQPGSWDHFWQNFDKILAVGLFGVGLLVLLHLIHHGSDQASVQWMENLVGQIWSSIAILLGVAKMLQRQADKNGNGNGNGHDTVTGSTTTTVAVSGTTTKTMTPPVVPDGN